MPVRTSILSRKQITERRTEDDRRVKNLGPRRVLSADPALNAENF